jgi:hypothetical protein
MEKGYGIEGFPQNKKKQISKEEHDDYFCGESYRLSFKIYTEQETFSLLES